MSIGPLSTAPITLRPWRSIAMLAAVALPMPLVGRHDHLLSPPGRPSRARMHGRDPKIAFQPSHRHRRRHRARVLLAHAARDPGDTISDFKFSPGTLTIHVGDTVTWVNNGPSEHSATATNGSFNTGLLKKGQSGSHTFTQVGTYSYICAIHPFMHGTIVVLASASSGSSQSSASSASSAPTSSGSGAGTTTSSSGTSSSQKSASASGQSLPMTGLDLASAVLAGIALLGLGGGLRRASASKQAKP